MLDAAMGSFDLRLRLSPPRRLDVRLELTLLGCDCRLDSEQIFHRKSVLGGRKDLWRSDRF